MYRWYFALFALVAMFAVADSRTRVSSSDTLQVESAPVVSTVSTADCCAYPPPKGGGG